MKRVYLDHNATTPLRPEARDLWLRCSDELTGNPSSVHAAGRAARHALDEARERTAAALGAHEDEIFFTSGGTEANNIALLGGLRPRPPGEGLVTTAIEHSSVLGAADQLEREGRPVVRVPVDSDGFPSVTEILSLAQGCGMVSAIAANNEVGTLLPLDRIGAGLAELAGERPWFHTDAVQALGRIPVRLAAWQVDLASFSAHKLGGPLGVGVLFRRRDPTLQRRGLQGLAFGGGQEGGLRPGTENVPAIAAAGLAIELAVREQLEFQSRTRALCLAFWRQLQLALPGVRLLGPPIDSERRLPNTLNLSMEGVDGRVLVTRLDLDGLEVSAGSACASGSVEPSHVLMAMGLSPERARAGLRISLGRTSDARDIHVAVDILRKTLAPAS